MNALALFYWVLNEMICSDYELVNELTFKTLRNSTDRDVKHSSLLVTGPFTTLLYLAVATLIIKARYITRCQRIAIAIHLWQGRISY